MRKGVWLIICLGLLCGCEQSEVSLEAPVSDFGEVREVFEDFLVVDGIEQRQNPVSFEENGHYGFKSVEGEVLVTPIYEAVIDFENGIGKVGADLGGKIIWKFVDLHGQITAYDWMAGYENGLCLVGKKRHFGLINTLGDQVVPLVYEAIRPPFHYADKDGAYLAAYALRDGEWVLLNLTEGYESKYKPYRLEHSEDYARVLSFEGMDLVVVNGVVLLSGRSERLGSGFPFCLLDGMTFQLYNQDGFLGKGEANLTLGKNRQDLMVSFANLPEDATYFAVLEERKNPLVSWAPLANERLADEVAMAYLRDRGLENTPFSVIHSWQGDLLGNGKNGAIIEVNDDLSRAETMGEAQDGAQFLGEKEAFVQTILVVNDLTEAENYQVLAENICRGHEQDFDAGVAVRFVVDLDADGIWELILEDGMGYYRLVELNNEPKEIATYSGLRSLHFKKGNLWSMRNCIVNV